MVLGHWSRFIETGAERLDTEIDGPQKLLVSAYRNPAGSIVMVIVNLNLTDSRQIGIQGSHSKFDSIAVHATSPDFDLELTYQGAPEPVIIPAAGVVTVVLNSAAESETQKP